MQTPSDPCDGIITTFLDDGSVKLTTTLPDGNELVKFVSSSHLIVPACLQLRTAINNGQTH